MTDSRPAPGRLMMLGSDDGVCVDGVCEVPVGELARLEGAQEEQPGEPAADPGATAH